MVCVLIGPWKKKRPWVQALVGMEMATKTLWPGARTPLTGLKVMCPGTLVKAVQCKLLALLARESTRALQR